MPQDRAPRGNSLTHALQRFDAVAAPCVESVAQPGQLIEANARFEQAAHKAQPLQRPLVIEPPTVLQATRRMHQSAQHIIAQDMDADTGRTSKPGNGIAVPRRLLCNRIGPVSHRSRLLRESSCPRPNASSTLTAIACLRVPIQDSAAEAETKKST